MLADAVSTPYAGLTDRAGLRQGEAIGLWGIGGLGVHAVMVARMVGAAPIIALDPSPVARQRALDRGADRDEARASLLALPGIGPWTADYISMRALGDPDVFLPTDIGVRNALTALGRPPDDARHADPPRLGPRPTAFRESRRLGLARVCAALRCCGHAR